MTRGYRTAEERTRDAAIERGVSRFMGVLRILLLIVFWGLILFAGFAAGDGEYSRGTYLLAIAILLRMPWDDLR
jgi:hypothetical protein